MSLQLHTQNTVIDFYLVVGEDKHKRASLSLVTHQADSGLCEFEIRELGIARNAACCYNGPVAISDQTFAVYVNDAEVNHEVAIRPYLDQRDGLIWLNIDAPECVYVGRHRFDV